MSGVGEIQERFREVMRRCAQGVTIVTFFMDGKPHGITVSSFTSLSMNPPLVMLAIAKDIPSHEWLVGSTGFGVSILAHDQAWLSERFAGRDTLTKNRFEGVEYEEGEMGIPMIKNAVAWIECRRWRTYEGGDHTILVGEVVNARVVREDMPLVYYNRNYTYPAINK